MFARFLNLKTFIQQANIGTKWSLQKHSKVVCQKLTILSCTKWTHLKNPKVKGSSERWPKRWPNDDHFLSFWVLHIPTESAKMASLLVRIHFHCCCCCCYFFLCCCFFCCFCFYFFQSFARFMPTNTKPSGTIGDTQKTMTVSATSFRGCNRFSPLLMWVLMPYLLPLHIQVRPRLSSESIW